MGRTVRLCYRENLNQGFAHRIAMAFVKYDEKKGISLPGLIDIIFLLLIFALVTLSVSQAKVETQRGGDKEVEFDLPETKMSETEEVEEVLQTLLLQIEHLDNRDTQSPKVVFVLRPSLKDSVTLQKAKSSAMRDSLFAVFPSDFIRMDDREFSQAPPCTLISWAIHNYKNENFFEPNNTNSIEIRAVKDTEFRIINFILERCSVYGDTIPRIVFRTLTGKEVRSGL